MMYDGWLDDLADMGYTDEQIHGIRQWAETQAEDRLLAYAEALEEAGWTVEPPAQSGGPEQKPGRKSHDATSDRAPVSVTFCMDDGCRYAAGHDGPHDITWQNVHIDGRDGANPQTGAST